VCRWDESKCVADIHSQSTKINQPLKMLKTMFNVFVPPLPASLEELWSRITEVVTTIDADMIQDLE